MDVNSCDEESLRLRIQQLEQERDELHKDIEQLCMQQAGPGYLAVATKMHFQRIFGLEQEIESLKKKIAASSRENLNLQEELSEAYRIKTQLADLHSAEVAKNSEAEKQLKFFQGCVAAAFAERDTSMMEAEKAKENAEFMSKQFNDLQRRIEELTTDCSTQKKLNEEFQARLEVKVEQIETFKKVMNKFYQIRQYSADTSEDIGWDIKCACLLDDPADMWSFNDATTAKYISALEKELEMVRKSADNLQNKLRMGLDIENHLKRRVHELEKKRINTESIIKNILELQQYHSECRIHIQSLLDDGKSLIKSVIDAIDEKIKEFESRDIVDVSSKEENEDEHEGRDVHINTDVNHDLLSKIHVPESHLPGGSDDASAALSLALQHKVSTLLLMSQQEERHLLDRNVNTVLQRKIEELQRNLLQVTNEKVRALMELAQLKQENHMLKEKDDGKGDNEKVDVVHRRVDSPELGGRLTNLLKRTNLKRWVGTHGNETEVSPTSSMDFARMKIENATLRESMESMEHLITSVHRLRLSLMKVKESTTSKCVVTQASKSVDEIIFEAKQVRTALGSSLPVSWSPNDDSGIEKRETVSAAGFEMVELIILAAQVLKEYSHETGS